MNVIDLKFDLLQAWNTAGYAKIPRAVRNGMKPHLARIVWERAIREADAEVPKSLHYRDAQVTRLAANRTFLEDSGPVSLFSMPESIQQASFDGVTIALERAAKKALAERVKDSKEGKYSAESLYERWINWTGQPTDWYSEQANADQKIAVARQAYAARAGERKRR